MSSPSTMVDQHAGEQRAIAAILDDFALFDDWEQRYQYLVELGERLPPMPAALKTEDNRVQECMSLLHVHAARDTKDPARLHFQADCDTAIIKGVVALLVGLFDGRTASEIEHMDVDALFAGLHLQDHLSPNRHVGVFAIVRKMTAQARALA